MKHHIEGAPSFSHIHIELAPKETIICESDAMASMDPKISHAVKMNGGFFPALGRKFFGKESFFVNFYSNKTGSTQNIILTQKTPGDIVALKLNGNGIFIQAGTFIACTPGVKLKLKWAGFRSWFSREGLFRFYAQGKGILWFGAYGRIIEKELAGEYLVDSSHLVAYGPKIQWRLQLAGGLFSSFFGGEGFVSRLSGQGKIYMQSRSLSGLAHWINPKL